MRAGTWAGSVGVAGLMLGLLAALPAAPTVQLPAPEAHPAGSVPRPPARRTLRVSAHIGLPAALGRDADIARLGRRAPRLDPLRRAFLDSTNLRQFALERLPRAQEGDGASQYYIYLALDQCRSYLGGDYEMASENLERMMGAADLGAEERIAWQAEYEHCRGFALGDWSALGDALGSERPGAAIEYASVWFERAALAGHAVALAEQALRPGPYGAPERQAMLEEALAGAGPDVYWLLFAHSGEAQAGESSAPALAWLLVACRAGQDCGEQARWYRSFACVDERRCAPGESALEYYWRAAPVHERDQAWAQAIEIEALLAEGRWQDLPMPDLDARDYRRLWTAQGA